jgi:hypothetical protein
MTGAAAENIIRAWASVIAGQQLGVRSLRDGPWCTKPPMRPMSWLPRKVGSCIAALFAALVEGVAMNRRARRPFRLTRWRPSVAAVWKAKSSTAGIADRPG